MINLKHFKFVEWCLVISIFIIFMGHGIIALFGLKPQWVGLITSFGFSNKAAVFMLPFIGTVDIVVALMALIKPLRIILIWAAVWGFATALSRPIAGEPVWEFLERAPNWLIPLMLLAIHDFPKKFKDLLRIK